MFRDKKEAATQSPSKIGEVGWKRALVRSECFVWLAVGMVVLVPTLTWLSPGFWERPWLEPAAVATSLPELTLEQALLGWGVVMVPVGVLAFGLSQVAVFLRRMRREGSFTREAAACVFRLGCSLLATAGLLPLARVAALALVHHWAGLAGLRGMFVPGAMICALASIGVGMLAIAQVLRHAVAVAEENQRFV